MIPITIAGTEYASIAEAHRAVSPQTLKLITARLRLRNGWNVADALLTPPIPAELRRGWKEHRT